MNSQSVQPSVVTLGNYDGVHLAHRALVSRARAIAHTHQGLRTIALTFHPHPAQVLAPQQAPPMLTTVERRVELLRGAGADEVVVQPFDAAFAALSPEAFVRKLLVERIGARAVVVGYNFRFGRARAGDLTTLRDLGGQLGFEVHTVDAVEQAGGTVSSSAIRDAVAHGDLPRATALLGRVHEMEGCVVEGDRRGRTLGFPTANLASEPVLAPPDGVYAVRVRILEAAPGEAAPEDRLLAGVANLGTRPTFEAGRSLEVHILDENPALYGARLRVGFVARLRGEERFAGVDALKAQIARDVEASRQVLATAHADSLRWM